MSKIRLSSVKVSSAQNVKRSTSYIAFPMVNIKLKHIIINKWGNSLYPFSHKWPNIVVAEVNIQMTFKANIPAETRKRYGL